MRLRFSLRLVVVVLTICFRSAVGNVYLAAMYQSSASACNTCPFPWVVNNQCACPAGTQHLNTYVDAVFDCYNPSLAQYDSQLHFCVGGCGKVVFGGVYQVNTVATSCRHSNPYTAGCSCPSGYTSMSLTVWADVGTPTQTTVVICYSALGNTGFYGETDASSCVNANPVTSACSCPANTYSAHQFHFRTLTYTTSWQGAYIVYCAPDHIAACTKSPTMSFSKTEAARSFTSSDSPSPSMTQLESFTGSPSPSASPTTMQSNTPTPSSVRSMSRSLTSTTSPSQTLSPSPSESADANSATHSITASFRSASIGLSRSNTVSASSSTSLTPTLTVAPSETHFSSTIGDSLSSSQSSSSTPTMTAMPSQTHTPSQSVSIATLSGPRTPSRALSRSRSITMTPSPSLTPTATSSWTSSATRSDTRSASWTFTVPTHSNISSLTPTSTHSPSRSQSSTSTSTRTRSVSTSLTATVSALRSITLPVLDTESVNVSTVSVSSSATASWCITPVRPGMRLVRQLAMPSTAWTAQSNHDAGVIVDAPVTSASQNGGRLLRFNDSFLTSSHASDVISIAYQKSSDGTPPSVADFDLILAAPYATYAALSHVSVSATTGALSAVLSIPSRDVLRVHFVFDATAAAVPTYTQQTVSLTLPLRSFACFDPQVYLGTTASSSSLSVAVMFTPVPLAVPLTAVSSTAYASMIVTFVAGSPTTAAVSSRISLLRGYVDCAYDAAEDGGFSVTGYYYGPAAGQYLRGAVVGNMALLYGMCVALVALCLLLGCVVACFRQAGVAEASRMILDMMHVPSVFVVPLAQTLQPTVAAAVQLLFARAGDSKGDVLVSVVGLAGVAFFVMYFTVVLLQQQPWSLAPRSSASLQKRLNIYGRVFFWLRGKESRLRDRLARALFTLFEAKEHWQLADRPEAKRVKRRLLMLFEDTRRMWYPVLDLWSSVALAVVAGFAPLSTSTVCFWQLVLTTALFAALLVVSVLLRPALSNAGTCNLALMNGLNFISTAALLVNSIKVNDAAINVATGALMMTALVSAVVSIPGLIRLFVRLYTSMRCVLATFPPRQWLLKICGLPKATTSGDAAEKPLSQEDDATGAIISSSLPVTDDALLTTSCAAVEIFDDEAVELVHDFDLFDFMRELLQTSIVDQVIALSDAGRAVVATNEKPPSCEENVPSSNAGSHSCTAERDAVDDDVWEFSKEFLGPKVTDQGRSQKEDERKSLTTLKEEDETAATVAALMSSSTWRARGDSFMNFADNVDEGGKSQMGCRDDAFGDHLDLVPRTGYENCVCIREGSSPHEDDDL